MDGGPTVAAHLPASLRGASWIDSGTRLRALVLVERAGNEQSLSNLRVLAAAPEEDVAAVERREAARAQQEAARRRRGQSAVPLRLLSRPRGDGPDAGGTGAAIPTPSSSPAALRSTGLTAARSAA